MITTDKRFATVPRYGYFHDWTRIVSVHKSQAAAKARARKESYTDAKGIKRNPLMVVAVTSERKGYSVTEQDLRRDYPLIW